MPTETSTIDRGELLGDWIGGMRRRGLSPGTIDKRERLIRGWLVTVDDPWSATALDVERWIDVHEWLSASTRYGAVSHLHAFFRWAIRAGHTTVDPTVLVERPRLHQRLPRPIHPTDLAIALTLAEPTMHAALLLASTSGLRCCELARLQWDDIHDGNVRVLGKGSKERIVPLHPSVTIALEALERTGVHVLDGWQSKVEYHPGMNASRRIGDYLHGLAIAASAHQLRHYCGTEALRATGDLRKVQALLGHSSPATTAMYTALDVSDLVAVVNAIPIPVVPW